MQIIKAIQNRIYEIRSERVIIDRDLAALYEVETKALNLAVKRNSKRFPKDFMFQLTKEEFEILRFQIETSEKNNKPLRFQIETSKGRGGTRYLPYAFTEQGVAMLSGILNSEKAINMNINTIHATITAQFIVACVFLRYRSAIGKLGYLHTPRKSTIRIQVASAFSSRMSMRHDIHAFWNT